MSTEVTVITNSFKVKSLPTRTYYQYDVLFTPDDPKPQKRQRLIHTLQTETCPQIFTPRAVYDGNRLLYASHNIPNGVYRVHGSNQNADSKSSGWWEIQITRTAGDAIKPLVGVKKFIESGEATSETLTATNLLQLLLSQAKNQASPNTGRAYYIPEGKQLIRGMAVELWRGYFQAVRPTTTGMIVNVDTTVSAMYMSGPLLAVCMAVLGAQDVRRLSLHNTGAEDFKKIERHLKNKLIYVKTRDGSKRTKTVREIIPAPVGPYQFNNTTIADHYRDAYSITLQYPNTIGICTTGKNAPFKVIIPLELCEMVPGQLYKKKLPPDATAAVVGFAALSPAERLKKILPGGSGQEHSPVQDYSQSEYLIDAGMLVDQQAITLRAHLLKVPPVIYDGKRVEPRDGAWNVLGVKFKTARQMQKWGIVNFDTQRISRGTVNKTISSIVECSNSLGMTVSPPPDDLILAGNAHNVRQPILQVCNYFRGPANVEMIIFLLPAKADEVRTQIKYICDVELGVRSQCLREPKVQRANNQYFNNVALKLNARLGGANSVVESPAFRELKTRRFMIIGADVAHPGPGSNRPSVASLVWSHDPHGAEYCATTRVQLPRSEIISDLKNMVKLAVNMFGEKHKNGPQAILFFRDGVSEGEFTIVQRDEIKEVKAAFDEIWAAMKLDPKTIPKLTFIVVGKRHHVSFFPLNPNDRNVGDKTGNCRAGLAVHDGLANPQFPDFYLQSHAAIKGTSRSAHYTVLQDEIFGGNLNKLQEVSFALCHIYAKATRSVSIPAPVYYADLACGRGKFHIDPQSDMDIDGSATTGASTVFSLDPWSAAFKRINPHVQASMYFL
ncbi:argonaute-like protein [Mycena alexandri]|uniref:Argonaute-like protein n=1 Tax=Mycena alexandri TaxID=1745969 RepID=A0AAD6TB56_9AGAR|nr:argonaute-like protein [Mycena alexandri]